ncbi:hypothetical protein OnM2_058001 [Erysiphe neolycopersici]|uniref:Uncharacterized protein n=1 Tax=Erysiphe neolycopersici TaxID=212602 RepID=A0A420HQL9_9PEZI|nr:hypothetical protein OnM2_058001 [Erysiphe neolycopersici]
MVLLWQVLGLRSIRDCIDTNTMFPRGTYAVFALQHLFERSLDTCRHSTMKLILTTLT